MFFKYFILFFNKVVGSSTKLYNPHPIDFVVIPHETYTEEQARNATDLAQEIIMKVQEFMQLRE